MFTKLVDAMFGCRHAHYTFPLTVRVGVRRNSAVHRTGTYVTCLDCGREFMYDWQQMKIVKSQPKKAARLVTNEAA